MDIDTKVIPVGLKESVKWMFTESTEVTGWYDRGPKPAGKEVPSWQGMSTVKKVPPSSFT